MTKKILVADDESYIRRLLEETLSDFQALDVEVTSVTNGENAFNAIKDDPPDLVFLDVMMPKMDGFSVCQKIKKELRMTNVYIVIVSAKSQDVDKKGGAKVGADEYLTKPFDPEKIISIAQRVLGLELLD